MSSSATPRVTRAASRARSEELVALPPVIRTSRGRNSRRGSPALAANPPADDNDNEVDPHAGLAYGAQGKPAEVQLQAHRIAKDRAINPIAQTVSAAEAFDSSANQLVGSVPLGPVAEGDETSTFWAPANRAPTNVDSGSQTVNLGSQHVNFLDAVGPRATRLFAYLMNFAIFAFLFFLCFFGGLHGYKWAKGTSTNTPQSTIHSALRNITRDEFAVINTRLDRLERYWNNPSRQASPHHQINWFEPGFGAMIDVRLSSPTTTLCNPTWRPFPFGLLLGRKCPQLPISPPHRMALQTWEDPVYDRWCSPNSGGKTQLAIQIERDIMPTNLVVEYMAKEASPTGYMTTAPKEIELWVRVEDAAVRENVRKEFHDWYPELSEDSSPQGRELHLTRSLSDDFVRVGRWIYDIYNPYNVQYMPLPTDVFIKHGLHTSKFVIRVNSNWGNVQFTCISRFRMTGVDKSGIEENIEPEQRRGSIIGSG